jgi:chemotaxis protein methyltransferase WspC
MSLDHVLNLVSRRIGLDPETLGPGTVAAAVAARMQATAVADPAAFAARLAGDPAQFEALVDQLVVPETWFFRGGEVFRHPACLVAGMAREQPGGPAVRILSVPCSTGEEPYSLAIALGEVGVPETSWTLDAVDLSTQHLDRARTGRYSDFSFRQTEAEVRRRYFREANGKWEIEPGLRQKARFRAGNLIDPLFLAGEPPFDLVLCRNLFIYLRPEARRQAADAIDRLLAADGWLCMGHAEPIHLSDTRFQPAGPEGLFLYRRQAGTKRQLAAGSRQEVAQQAGGSRQEAASNRPKGAPPEVRPRLQPESMERTQLAPQEATCGTTLPLLDLVEVRRLADRGHLDQAWEGCMALLERAEPSADVLALMGVIHLARQETDDAVTCFRKALYWQPDHPEALTHLMLRAQQAGDSAQAARLRERLQRRTAGGDM